MYEYIISKVSKDLNYSKDIVKKVYQSYWLFIRETLKDINLDQDLTEEEFNKLRVSFNIPSIGKLVCRYKDYKAIKNKKGRVYDKTK